MATRDLDNQAIDFRVVNDKAFDSRARWSGGQDAFERTEERRAAPRGRGQDASERFEERRAPQRKSSANPQEEEEVVAVEEGEEEEEDGPLSHLSVEGDGADMLAPKPTSRMGKPVKILQVRSREPEHQICRDKKFTAARKEGRGGQDNSERTEERRAAPRGRGLNASVRFEERRAPQRDDGEDVEGKSRGRPMKEIKVRPIGELRLQSGG